MKKTKKIQVRGKCIFCGQGDLSHEHFWPQWASDVLRINFHAESHIKISTVRSWKKEVVSHKRKERQGHVMTNTLRVVCRNCNSGWMSALENETKDILTPLMRGEHLDLNDEMQSKVAQWITCRVMVGEHSNKEEVVIPFSDLNAFKENRTIPWYMNIWIGRCISDQWNNAYLKNTALLSLPTEATPSLKNKNTHTTAFGIGEFFTYSAGCITKGIDFQNYFTFSDHLIKLWPLSGKVIIWPHMRIINSQGCFQIANSLDALADNPHVIRKNLPF